MTRKTDYTWEDVGDLVKPDGSATTQAEKEAIAKEWNKNNSINGEVDQRDNQINREKRNALLTESDWTQIKDVVVSNETAWKTYRQALRDLPTHSNWPDLKDEDWPIKPS